MNGYSDTYNPSDPLTADDTALLTRRSASGSMDSGRINISDAPVFNAVRWPDVKLKPVDWLMLDRIPYGELTIADGPGGVGKTTVVLDIIARATRGAPMPDGTPCLPLNALIIAEEDRKEVIKARLIAAGADLERVTLLASVGVDGHFFSLPSDWKSLFDAFDKYAARIGAIDALLSHLDKDIHAYNPQEVRRALIPLSRIAHEAQSNPAIIAIRHWGKSTRAAADRGLGSSDFRNVSRSGLSINRIREEKNRFAVAVSKSNLGRACDALTYSLENSTIEGDGETVEVAKVVWRENANISADDLANDALPSAEEQTRTDAACDFLGDVLSDGPHPSKEVYGLARKEDFSPATLKRAAQRLQIVQNREGFPSHSTWSLRVAVDSQSVRSAHEIHSGLSEPTEPTEEPNQIGGIGHSKTPPIEDSTSSIIGASPRSTGMQLSLSDHGKLCTKCLKVDRCYKTGAGYLCQVCNTRNVRT